MAPGGGLALQWGVVTERAALVFGAAIAKMGMYLFICPHCHDVLKVAEVHLGMRGRCNKCGGRIALIGDRGATGPQAASPVVEEMEDDGSGVPPKPPTDKQLAYLRALGASPDRIVGIDRERASTMIDELKVRRQESEAPTEKQLAHLKRLGASARQLAGVRSKAEAAALIEELHLLPTANQMAYLKELGATGAQLASVKTRAAASDLIDELSEARPARR